MICHSIKRRIDMDEWEQAYLLSLHWLKALPDQCHF